MKLSIFARDLLKILSVVTVVAEAAEPVVDLTNPGIAEIYNLSAQQGATLLSALLGAQAPPSAPAAPPPPPVAAAPAPAPAAPIADPAPAEVATPGPGLHNEIGRAHV